MGSILPASPGIGSGGVTVSASSRDASIDLPIAVRRTERFVAAFTSPFRWSNAAEARQPPCLRCAHAAQSSQGMAG